MATKLKLGTNNNWATKVDKLLAYNDENGNFKPIEFDADRDSTSTRVNKAGLVENVEANRPRVQFSGNNGYLLLEPTRTQLAEYTNGISSANGYGLTNGTLATDSHTAPDGSNDASTFQATSSNGQFQKVKIGSSGVQYTVSVYVKRKTGTGTVYLRAIENTNTAVTVTNEWTRVSLTVTSTSTNLRYGMALATSGDEIYVWGFQIEAGNYATSLIPNISTGQITRTQDRCFNGGDVNLFNLTEGTFFIDVNPFIPTANTNIGISNGTDAQKIVFIFQSNGTQVRTFSSGGVSEFDSLTFNQRNKIAVSFKTNEYKIFINGTKVGTDTSASVPTGMNRLNFSNRTNTASYFEGEIYQTMVFNEALSDSELIALTS
jgi:hypothetical protein